MVHFKKKDNIMDNTKAQELQEYITSIDSIQSEKANSAKSKTLESIESRLTLIRPINKFLDLINNILINCYPDLFFGGHKSDHPLILNINNKVTRYIRLRLLGDLPLNLETIEIYQFINGEKYNIAPEAEILASSIYPGTEYLLQQKKLLDSQSKGLGIHTNSSTNEWVCLKFKEEVNISCIVIYNRDDNCRYRAWKIVVESSLDNVSWEELYNHQNRINSYYDMIVNSIKYSKIFSNFDKEFSLLIYDCLKILDCLLQQQFSEAENVLSNIKKRHIITQEQIQEIKQGFSKEILPYFEKHWSIHSINRTFKYWSDDEKKNYLIQANQLINDLRQLSPFVCMGFGFVLGYIRESDLIGHDDDIDIIIAFDVEKCHTIREALEKLTNHLISIGYEVSGNHFSHRWIRRENMRIIDVFVGIKEEEKVSWYPSNRKNLLITDVFPPLNVEILNITMPIPSQPIRYLEETYGESWNIPDQKFSHSWNNQNEYSDIA
jgi:F5/8 type C domain